MPLQFSILKLSQTSTPSSLLILLMAGCFVSYIITSWNLITLDIEQLSSDSNLICIGNILTMLRFFHIQKVQIRFILLLLFMQICQVQEKVILRKHYKVHTQIYLSFSYKTVNQSCRQGNNIALLYIGRKNGLTLLFMDGFSHFFSFSDKI